MITDAILGLLDTLITALLALLPSVHSHLSLPDVSGAGAVLNSAAPVVPVSDCIAIVSLCVIAIPAWVVYRAFSWVWNHVPTIAGFGTGGKS